MKKFLSLLLTVLITLLACFPFATLNTRAAVSLPLSNYPNGASYPQNQCWAFAQMVYKQYWGYEFTNNQYTDDNIIKNVPTTESARKATEDNLRTYISQAPIGSCLRISVSLGYVTAANDGDAGHSIIIAQRDNNGFTAYHALGGQVQYKYITYNSFANYWTVNSKPVKNLYIKYIKSGENIHECIHSDWIETTPPTCNSIGTKVQRCTICGKTLTLAPIPKIDHNSESNWTITNVATCTTTGTKVKYCTVCDEIVSTAIIPSIDHTYDDEWVVLIEPTTTNRGIKARYCLECNIPDYEEIPMLDGAINLASGKDYVTSDIYASNGVVLYPDENGVTLTDGKNAAYNAKYSDTAFVGFNINSEDYDKNGYSSVTVDLGNIYAVDKFSAKVASSYNSVAGIYAPALVTVYVSTNNQTWVKAGSVVPTDDSSVSTVATTISLDRSVWARYVQFRFVAEATWIFVTEVEVYEGDMTDEPIPNYISGDVNNDFTVDSLDYLLVKRACFGTYDLTDDEFARADVNADSNMNSTDYLLVKRIAFGTYKVQ